MSTTTKTAEDYKDDPRVVAQADIETHEEIPYNLDPKGGNMAEWPADLRVRQLPK